MHVNENHLMDISSPDFKEMEEAIKAIKAEYRTLPPSLQNAAKRKLKGRNSAYVSKTSGGKLSKWAAQERKKKRKLQKAAKKKNR